MTCLSITINRRLSGFVVVFLSVAVTCTNAFTSNRHIWSQQQQQQQPKPFILHSSSTEIKTPSSSEAAPQMEIDRRRNLAIISHPDSGKTTMTEKLLLYGGAIQQAGAVRQKAEQRATASDFMEMEKERGTLLYESC